MIGCLFAFIGACTSSSSSDDGINYIGGASGATSAAGTTGAGGTAGSTNSVSTAGNGGAAGTVATGAGGVKQQAGVSGAAGKKAGAAGKAGKAGTSGNVGGAGGTPVNTAPDGPVALPDGSPGIAFDDIKWGPNLRRVIVPAGRSGNVDLIDPDTNAVTALSGLSATATYSASAFGTKYGSTSATEVGNYIAAVDQTTAKLHILDPKTKTSVKSLTLVDGAPDYIFYVEPTRELYLTQPGPGIAVYSLSTEDPPTPTKVTNIAVTGGPESLAVDAKRNRAYTNAYTGTTYAIDLKSRAIVGTWSNGCSVSLGVHLDEARGFLFIGCIDGKVVVLDAANNGTKLSELSTGGGLDMVAFSSQLNHLYAPDNTANKLAIVAVSSKGILSLLGNISLSARPGNVVADDRGHVWVCDPDHGQVLRITDTYSKTTQ
jgi:hypothetical protein